MLISETTGLPSKRELERHLLKKLRIELYKEGIDLELQFAWTETQATRAGEIYAALLSETQSKQASLATDIMALPSKDQDTYFDEIGEEKPADIAAWLT